MAKKRQLRELAETLLWASERDATIFYEESEGDSVQVECGHDLKFGFYAVVNLAVIRELVDA